MNKILIMFFVLIFLIGCKGQKDSRARTEDEIHKGTDGLVMSFLKNAPPPQVYASTEEERSQFNVVVNLENKGAYDIENGYLTLILENDYMSIDYWSVAGEGSFTGDSQIMFNLEGKSLSNPFGGEEIVTVQVNARKFPETLSETHTSSILLASCYRYQTNMHKNVCVDTDIYNLRNLDKACEVKDLSLTDQGAPVAVTKVEVEMLPHENEGKVKPLFTIYVENKGVGEVIRADESAISNACSSESLKIGENDLNVVYIKAYLSGEEYELECNPKYIKLRNKKGFIRCNLKEGKDKKYGTYKSPLIIELYYGYMQTKSKEVEIRKPVTY